MKRKIFSEYTGCKSGDSLEKQLDLEKLMEIQALALANTYHSTCFDVKQLQEVLGVGETNVYRLLRSGQLSSQTVGRRKVVSVSALAQFLVIGKNNS